MILKRGDERTAAPAAAAKAADQSEQIDKKRRQRRKEKKAIGKVIFGAAAAKIDPAIQRTAAV